MSDDSHLVFDDDLVAIAAVDFAWQLVDPEPVEDTAVDASGVWRGLLVPMLANLNRVPRGDRLRVVGVRTLALATIIFPDAVIPGASLGGIARHYGMTPKALAERLANSPVNLPHLRRRRGVRRYRQVRITRP